MSGKNRQQPNRKDTKVNQDQNLPQAPASQTTTAPEGENTAQDQASLQDKAVTSEGQAPSSETSGDTANGAESASQDAGAEKQEQTPEPTPEPTPAPTAAPISASDVLREKSEFEQYLDAVRVNGSENLVGVLDLLIGYQAVMGLNTVTSVDTINQQQGALWRAIKSVINSADDFEKGFLLLINFFRHYSVDGAFQQHLVFRGFEHTKLNKDASRAFQNILTILSAAAESKNKTAVRKTVDLARALESSVITEEARMRVIGYFN